MAEDQRLFRHLVLLHGPALALDGPTPWATDMSRWSTGALHAVHKATHQCAHDARAFAGGPVHEHQCERCMARSAGPNALLCRPCLDEVLRERALRRVFDPAVS